MTSTPPRWSRLKRCHNSSVRKSLSLTNTKSVSSPRQVYSLIRTYRSNMTREEHHDIIQILTTESWQARKKMLEYMKTVKIDDKVSDIKEVPKEATTGLVAPQEAIVAVNLNGSRKPDYPEYTGPVNWEPTI